MFPYAKSLNCLRLSYLPKLQAYCFKCTNICFVTINSNPYLPSLHVYVSPIHINSIFANAFNPDLILFFQLHLYSDNFLMIWASNGVILWSSFPLNIAPMLICKHNPSIFTVFSTYYRHTLFICILFSSISSALHSSFFPAQPADFYDLLCSWPFTVLELIVYTPPGK